MGRLSGKGIVAAAIGATIGLALGFVPAWPMLEASSDADNGWFHDPDGGLLFIAALLLWLAMAVGAAAALALRRHRRAGLTGIVMVPAVPFLALAFASLEVPGPGWYLFPVVLGALVRVLVAPGAPTQRLLVSGEALPGGLAADAERAADPLPGHRPES